MDKVSPSGAFIIDFLEKGILPKSYFLFNFARSISVTPTVHGQLNEELLRYHTITTIPLAGTRRIGEEIKWDQPFLCKPELSLEQYDFIENSWKFAGRVAKSEPIPEGIEFSLRRRARLTEIESKLHPALNNEAKSRFLCSILGQRSYDVDLLRADIPKEDLATLLKYEEELAETVGLKIRDRVRLTFDVNYVHSLPEWALRKPRLLVK